MWIVKHIAIMDGEEVVVETKHKGPLAAGIKAGSLVQALKELGLDPIEVVPQQRYEAEGHILEVFEEPTLDVDLDELFEAIYAGEAVGVCLACGAINYGWIEPDAEGYECEECGAYAVEGGENYLLRL